jgi:hypothetical protein
VLVVVLVVGRVPASVVHVVDVIAVRHRNVAATLAMDVVMALVHHMAGRFTFVVVILVPPVQVSVVRVVDVILVWDRDVAASFAVGMLVLCVLFVDRARHRSSPPYIFFWGIGSRC